jgi:hypothetical protein
MAYLNFKKENLSRLIISLPFVIALLFVKSHLFIKFGLTFKIYAPFYLIFFLIMTFFFQIKINKILLLFSSIAIPSIFLVAFYHNDLRYIFYTANTVIALMIFSLVDRDLFIKIIKISSLIIFLMLIGAWITFLNIYFTNSIPETTFETYPGTKILRGVLSFGVINHYTGLYIFRASSIYDEPGTFSFVIVFIAAIRHFLNMDKKNTWVILILGFVTISLAHLVYVILHFLAEKINYKKFILFIFLLGLTFIIFLNYIPILVEIFNILFSRLSITSASEGFIEGNNRYKYWLYSITQLQNFQTNNWLFGIDEIETTECCSFLIYLVQLGLVGSWPYYLIMIFLFFYCIFKKNLIVFAIFLILIQRPEIQHAGSAFLLAAFLFSLTSYLKERRINTSIAK